MKVKNSHLVSTHGISLTTQWAKLVWRALDEWVAEDTLLGAEGWLEKHASQYNGRTPVRDARDGGILE